MEGSRAEGGNHELVDIGDVVYDMSLEFILLKIRIGSFSSNNYATILNAGARLVGVKGSSHANVTKALSWRIDLHGTLKITTNEGMPSLPNVDASLHVTAVVTRAAMLGETDETALEEEDDDTSELAALGFLPVHDRGRHSSNAVSRLGSGSESVATTNNQTGFVLEYLSIEADVYFASRLNDDSIPMVEVQAYASFEYPW